MTQDYAKPSTTRNKPGASKSKKASASKKAQGSASKARKPSGASQTPPPPPPKRGKLIFILIVLIGAFAAGLYLLLQLPETQTTTESTTKPAPKTIKEPEQAAQTEPEQRFKFYDLLPESEVIPPKVDSYQFKEKGAAKSYYYLVQTGSFRSQSDAERQKATIAFQGLKGNIKAVTNNSGTTWYRVVTGPFHSRSEMNSALDKLVNIGIEPLVKKIEKK